MKEQYGVPEMDVIKFEKEDIITLSNGGEGGGSEGGELGG